MTLPESCRVLLLGCVFVTLPESCRVLLLGCVFVTLPESCRALLFRLCVCDSSSVLQSVVV